MYGCTMFVPYGCLSATFNKKMELSALKVSKTSKDAASVMNVSSVISHAAGQLLNVMILNVKSIITLNVPARRRCICSS